MSAYHERKYQLARQQEIAKKRVTETTEQYVLRYQNILADIQSQGLCSLVQAEFSDLQQQVGRMQRQLASDPFAARDISLNISGRMHALPRLARQLEQEAQAAERAAYQEKLRLEAEHKNIVRAELVGAWQTELDSWEDRLIRNLALKDLAAARDRLLAEGANTTADDIRSELTKIRQVATEKAVAKRQIADHDSKQEAAKEIANRLLTEINSAELPRARVESLTERLKKFTQNPAVDTTEISRLAQETDAAITDEEVRRSVVKAVFKSLKDAGFVVQSPYRLQEADKDEVIIKASRPAGNQALFSIELDGRMSYKFDNYKGQTCQKDMAQVLPKLSEIYGVNLSDERVLWSNPDDVDTEMKPTPTQTTNKK